MGKAGLSMIGYAPFLGQVQLVPYTGFRLGQRVPMVAYGDEPAPHEGCERLGYNQSPIMEPELQAKMAQAQASGRSVVPMPTGRTLNPGTRSETEEAVYWSCPKLYPKFEPPGVTAGPTAGPSVAPPTGAPSPFPTALAVGGLAAAGLVAFFIALAIKK